MKTVYRVIKRRETDRDPAHPTVQSIKTINVKNVNVPIVQVQLLVGPCPARHPLNAHYHTPCLLGHSYKAGHQKLICSVSLPH